MKKTLLAAAALLTATAAAAQVAPQITPRDGVQTRAEVVQRAQTMFQRVDANRDGYLTLTEAQTMRGQRTAKMQQRRGQRTADPARRQARFDRLDADRNNVISREEWARADAQRADRRANRGMGERRMAMRGMNGRGGGMMLRMADANRDNRVSLQEATSAALQRFDRIDVNRDGQVTGDERRQARQQMRQQMQQAPVRG